MRASLKIVATILKYWSDHISRRPPLSTPPDIGYVAQYPYFDHTKAKTELGLDFTPIEDSIARAIAWFRENRYIS